jgi:hypothetical protein
MAQLCGIGDLDIAVEKFKIQNSKFKVCPKPTAHFVNGHATRTKNNFEF